MTEQLAVGLLFAASAVSAAVAAVRRDWFPKVEKLALAVTLAASGFLLQVTDFFNG